MRILPGMDSFEDHLPEGQPTIQTTGVRRLKKFIQLATMPSGYSTMGVITGRAGLGKIVAIQDYLDETLPLSFTGLPPVVKVKVKPDSTPKALAVDVLTGLAEKPIGANRYQLADEVAAAITRNLVRLLIVDEADRLTEASFDLLRHIHDKTGCPVVLVGLPDILKVIARQEKFQSRVGLRMNFPAVTRDEMTELVLPQMVFPHWTYSADNGADRAMGERIYEMVKSSMRKLRNLLRTASHIAEIDDAKCVTLDTIEEAFRWTPFDGKVTDNDDRTDDRRGRGEHEYGSEARHDAKTKRRL